MQTKSFAILLMGNEHLGFSLLMGLAGGPIMDVMMEAGHQLMNPGLYINTVLETVGGR